MLDDAVHIDARDGTCKKLAADVAKDAANASMFLSS
jgi:hypothetical protein